MLDGRRIQAQLLKGTLPLLVLATLRDGELHGYEIARRIRARGGEAFTLSEGSLYPALHRLRTGGAPAASWGAGGGGAPRRYYRLTKAGLAALERAEREWSSFSNGVAQVALGGN